MSLLPSEYVTVKLLMLGDGTVGKSDFLVRYVESRFDQNFIVSIGVDTRQKATTHKGQKVKVQVWDAAGNDQFQTLSPAYYSAAHGIMILYDITNQASFARVEYWKEQVNQHNSKDIPIIIVGNKTDLVDEHMVSLRIPKTEEDRLSSKLGAAFYSASAKTGDGVDEAFASLIDLVFQHRSIPCLVQPRSPETTRRTCGCSWWPLLHHKRYSQPAPPEAKPDGRPLETNQEVCPTSQGQGCAAIAEARPLQEEPVFPAVVGSRARDLPTAERPAGNSSISKITKALASAQHAPLVFDDGEESAEARSPKMTHVENDTVHAPCQIFMDLVCSSSKQDKAVCSSCDSVEERVGEFK